MRRLDILESGSRELFKAAIHGLALGLVTVMGVYNMAAWIQRRKPHLAINTIVYTALVIFEYEHVAHHRAAALRAEEAVASLDATTAAIEVPTDQKAA